MNQDNQSVIKLEENGKISSGKRIRHINIQYYFITDQIKNGIIVIEYCPTENMIAYFYTKPLQGKLFYKFRDQVLGLAPMDDIHIHKDHRSVLDEKSILYNKEIVQNAQHGKVSWADVLKRKMFNGRTASVERYFFIILNK